jgi:signal transduction histidine kinase
MPGTGVQQPLRVLLIEDSVQDAQLIVAELEQGGYDVTFDRVQTAETLRAALARPWDIVLSDYSMPGFSGPAALRILRELDRDLPFIIVSGTIGEETAVTALKAGADDFLVKDRLARLLPAVERELRETTARRDRHRLEEQLRQAQKMESIGRLAGGIAHDFNNILTTIVGYSDMALEQIGMDKPMSGDLLEIRRAAARATELTRQLLAFSRKQTLKVSPVDVNQVIRGAHGMLRRLVSEAIEFELVLARDLPLVLADPVQLEQVLLNLASNAGDAMPEGGRLTIASGAAAHDEVGASVREIVEAGRYVRLSVSDTGTGVPPELANRIFEPFFTTKEPGKGTGLGLATVYGIVKQLGGHLTMASELGRGTTFTMFFPAPDDLEGPPAADAARIAPLVATGPDVVLVVEDEVAVRRLVTRMLGRHGYTVLDAGGADEALAIAEQYAGPIHLVVSDVVMPGIGGAELARRLKAARPDLRVLFMSGYTGDTAIRRGEVDAGAQLLEKPFTARDLLETVRRLLER